MNYFITGGTGFIGKFLVDKLLKRDGSIYVLIRKESAHKLESLRLRYSSSDAARITPIYGDLTQPLMGLSEEDLQTLKGTIDHFFHLAAIYDMEADAESQQLCNVEGTRNAVECAEKMQAKCFNHVSSIAASGLYKGTFREDMFSEAENFAHPYFQTKHDSEGIVRAECNIPWRVYRPGSVVGHSQTGEIDKIDGPYYIFGILKKLREILPPWMPLVGIETGLMNVVPVDYVVDAMDYIAHLPGHDGECFHLTDPDHYSMSELVNIFAEAGHAPKLVMRIDKIMFSFIPAALIATLSKLPPVIRIKQALFDSLGMPVDASIFMKYETRYDSRDTQRLLEGSGIQVPRLSSYAAKVWDYWERNLDPDLYIDRSLEGNVSGKIALITGGSEGIGEAIAHKLSGAGATVILTARSIDKLERVKESIQTKGGKVFIYTSDISDMESCDQLIATVLDNHGHVDLLVNNAGRSIRRSIDMAYDRFHDYERTMQLNYFGALRLIMGFLPKMSERKSGHVINISSIGVLACSPRFSAYIASKSALEAFSRCAAAEYSDRNVNFTNINMPLVRTAMIAPTKIYEYAPAMTVDEAMDLVVDAVVNKPQRVATTMGKFVALANAIAPKLTEVMWNVNYRMFPDSDAALGVKESTDNQDPSNEQVALAAIMKGIYF